MQEVTNFSEHTYVCMSLLILKHTKCILFISVFKDHN